MHPRAAGILTLAVLLLGVGCAVVAIRPPAARPAGGPATEVSGERAMVLLQRVAAQPRPAGSPENARVRDLLAAELAALGLSVEQNRGVLGRELVNLALAIRGSAPTGTVLCMAHHDSVPRGPGAGDDGAGVVCWLEALRALRAREWQPRNDVLLLLTDGEELGMLGAHLFARTDPRVAAVKAVINLEAIGNGGPAYLFELGPRNGARVREYEAAVAAPAGSSCAEAVYHLLPNNTDLSVFLKRGVQGFNLALPCGSTAYHAPHDTAANLDPRSLQHMADSACALVARLGDADLATLAGDDVTFFDALGLAVIAWPRAWDPWIAFAALAAAVWQLVRRRAGLRAGAAGCVRHVGVVLLCGGATVAAWWGLDRAAAAAVAEPAWIPGNTTSGALLFAGATLLAMAMVMPRSGLDPAEAERRMHAGLVAWSLAGLTACFVLPGGAFVWSWPALLFSGLGVLPSRGPAAMLRLVPLAATLLVVLPILHLLVQLAQREPLVAVGLASLMAASLGRVAAPHLLVLANGGRALRSVPGALGGIALVAAIVIARWLAWRGGGLMP